MARRVDLGSSWISRPGYLPTKGVEVSMYEYLKVFQRLYNGRDSRPDQMTNRNDHASPLRKTQNVLLKHPRFFPNDMCRSFSERIKIHPRYGPIDHPQKHIHGYQKMWIAVSHPPKNADADIQDQGVSSSSSIHPRYQQRRKNTSTHTPDLLTSKVFAISFSWPYEPPSARSLRS